MSDLHSAAGSYAVDALDPVERAEFEAHLVGCAHCRVEVAEFAETLAEVSCLVSAAPPAALRDSVLDAVADVRQMADVRQLGSPRAARSAGHAGEAAGSGAEAAPRRALAPVTELRPLDPHEVTPLEEHPSVIPDTPWLGVAAALSDDLGRRSRWRDRVLSGLVAAAVVVALVLTGWVYVSREQEQTRAAAGQREIALLTAPDVKVFTSSVNGTPVSYVVSKQRGQAQFVGGNLAEPGRDLMYQLWTVKGGTATSAGLVRTGGNVRQWLSGDRVRDADGLALTVEPAPRGSSTPSGPLLFEVSLSPP